MVTMIVVTIQTKMQFIVPREHAHKTLSDVLIIDAFRQPGIAMEMMTVVMELMSLQSIANQKEERALAISSLATMETVSLEFIFVVRILS